MDVPLDDALWTWGAAERTVEEHRGRECVRFDSAAFSLETGLELQDDLDGIQFVD
jgi:hypothetical protein